MPQYFQPVKKARSTRMADEPLNVGEGNSKSETTRSTLDPCCLCQKTLPDDLRKKLDSVAASLDEIRSELDELER